MGSVKLVTKRCFNLWGLVANDQFPDERFMAATPN